MKNLFPKSENWIYESIILQNNNIDRNKINEIDRNHFERTGKYLSSWKTDEYLDFLNILLSVNIEDDAMREYRESIFPNETNNFLNLSNIPFINNYDYCGILAIIKIILDQPSLINIENPQQFISDVLIKISPVIYEIEPEESEYSLIPYKKYIPKNFSFEIVLNDVIINELIKCIKRNFELNAAIEIALTQPDYFLMINDHFKNYCYENAFDENLFPLLPESMRANHNHVKLLLGKNGKLLSLLSDEQKNNEELVMAAISNRPTSIQYASEQIKNNTSIFKVVLSKNGRALEFASAEIRDNDDLALIALRENYRSIDFFSERLRNDFEFMKLCLLIKPEVFKYASDKLKNVAEFIILSAARNKDTYKFVDCSLFINNEEICETILKSNGEALKIMPDNIKSNRRLVQIAIQENPYNIKYASDDILSDLEFMANVTKINPCTYLFCKGNLKNNEAFAYSNMFANPLIYEYLPVHLKNNPRFFALYIHANITEKLWKEFCRIDTTEAVNEINEQFEYAGGDDDLPF